VTETAPGTVPTVKTPFFYGWIVVLVAAMLGFLGTGFYSYSRGVFLPSLAEELADGSRFHIAMGFSTAGVVSAILAPFLGQFIDRYSPRKVILCGVCIVSISYLLLSTATNLVHYYLIVGVGMGVGMSCMGNLAWAKTVMSWFDYWRGRAIAIAVMGASLAGVMMPPLVTGLVENYGWRVGYMTFAGITFCALLPLVFFFMRDRPEDVGEVRDGRSYVEKNKEKIVELPEDSRVWHWKEMLKSGSFWSIALMFGTMACAFSAVMLHLYGHLEDLGLSPYYAAFVLSATAGCAALGKPIVGWMADEFGAKVTIWMPLIFQSVALLTLANANTFLIALLAACLYGFGYSGMSPLRSFAVSASIGTASFAAASGVLRVVQAPITLSASPLAGYIYDTTGSYKIAFFILSAVMLAACAGPFFIRAGGARERQKRTEQQSL
jgi:MFS family permease